MPRHKVNRIKVTHSAYSILANTIWNLWILVGLRADGSVGSQQSPFIPCLSTLRRTRVSRTEFSLPSCKSVPYIDLVLLIDAFYSIWETKHPGRWPIGN